MQETNHYRMCEFFLKEQAKYQRDTGNVLCYKNCPYQNNNSNTCLLNGMVEKSQDPNFKQNASMLWSKRFINTPVQLELYLSA